MNVLRLSTAEWSALPEDMRPEVQRAAAEAGVTLEIGDDPVAADAGERPRQGMSLADRIEGEAKCRSGCRKTLEAKIKRIGEYPPVPPTLRGYSWFEQRIAAERAWEACVVKCKEQFQKK